MKPPATLLFAGSALLFAGCSFAETEPSPALAATGAAHPEQSTLTLQTRAEQLPIDVLVERLSTVRHDTPSDHPSIAFLRADPSRLLRQDVFHKLDCNPDILRNSEVDRIVYEFFLSESRSGRFWRGAWLLARSGDQSRAATLFSHWESCAPADGAVDAPPRWDIGHVTREPRFVLSHLIFDLGESASMERIWEAFPALEAQDQLLVAHAAAGCLDTRVARAMLDNVSAARSVNAKEWLVSGLNAIVYQILSTKSVNGDWVEQEMAPLLLEMRQRGLLMRDLEKLVTK